MDVHFLKFALLCLLINHHVVYFAAQDHVSDEVIRIKYNNNKPKIDETTSTTQSNLTFEQQKRTTDSANELTSKIEKKYVYKENNYNFYPKGSSFPSLIQSPPTNYSKPFSPYPLLSDSDPPNNNSCE